MATPTLVIQNFAQIEEVSLELGDLTVLVGPQGTGKSLALQWLKIALDGKQIVGALRDAGQDNPSALIDFIFGVGMGSAWRSDSSVRFEDKAVTPRNLARLGGSEGRVFFIPAHRSMLISDGWAAPFQKLSPETPVVARLFSQTLFDLFSGNKSDTLFPRDRVLKKVYRDLINDAVFHGGTVGIDEDKQHTKRLELTHGTAQLPFMTWTAGQREFTPLLLGLYHLLPSRKLLKQPGIDWVVIEEPEMGLHPQAVSVFMLLVLDLLWRGYRVVLSTHSPLVLTAVWMLRRLRDLDARWSLVCQGFGVTGAQQGEIKTVAKAALTKSMRAHFLGFDGKKVRSKDISSLDPADEDDDIAGWGGLTGFGSRFADAVRSAVNEAG
jgi:energy-coupling factor transporter ATP-binding protein EcfA2